MMIDKEASFFSQHDDDGDDGRMKKKMRSMDRIVEIFKLNSHFRHAGQWSDGILRTKLGAQN